METLFGIPIDNLMVGLTLMLLSVLAFLAVLASRNRVLFRIGVRNISRRPAQTGLIVLGLMLATLLVSSSLVTGDTISYSIQNSAVKSLGQTDLIVQPKAVERGSLTASGNEGDAYIQPQMYEKIEQALDAGDLIDGLAPALTEKVPAAVPGNRRSLPDLQLSGLTESYARSFDPLLKENAQLSVSALNTDEAYLNAEAAEKLEVEAGDDLDIFVKSGPATIKVAGIYTEGGQPSTGPAAIMSLTAAQKLLNTSEGFNAVLISGKGDKLAGAEETKDIRKRLRPIVKDTLFEVDSVKQNALDDAEENAGMFTGLFLVFGQFSMVAGIMLIFLIFVMLAAERKTELGVMRALGSQRRDLLKIFVFEGTLYALLSGVVGSVSGIGVGWLMIKIMAGTLNSIDNFTLSFFSNPQSTIIAYAIGVIATFLVVTISAWRIGRVNIVQAIRDLPEPIKTRRSLKWFVLLIGVFLFGIFVTISGFSAEQRGTFGLGLSLLAVSVPLLTRWVRLPDRAAFSLAGFGLMVIWLAPDNLFTAFVPQYATFAGGLELFFLAGIASVTGAVWVVMYNSDILFSAINSVFGRLKGLPPMLKIAINYPMKNRVRTGLALAMFSLIVFTLIFMSALLGSMNSIYADTSRLSGGYDVQGVTGYVNPVGSISETLDQGSEKITSDDLRAVGSFAMAPVTIRQPDSKERAWTDYTLQGIDRGYADSVNYEFQLKASGYESDRDVWQALTEERNVAVVHAGLVPAKVSFEAGNTGEQWQLSGVFREDKKLPDLYIETKNQLTGKTTKLRIIGIVNEMSLGVFNGIITSQATLNKVTAIEVPPNVFWFRLQAGADIDESARSIATAFYKNGMQTETLEHSISENVRTSKMINRLLQGFMGLGLVVGIAALGVIAARSVVERRRQIGMIRAIGFERGMVQRTFMLETSFIALLGITLGSLLGLTLSEKVAGFMAKDMPGLVYQVPWLEVLAIAGLAYGAALLTTYLPSRQAAKVLPAEALRYE